MEIKLTVEHIPYGDLAVKLLPRMGDKLRRSGSLPLRMLAGMSNMPPEVIRQTVEALPREVKDELVAFLVNRNAEQLCRTISAAARERGVDLDVVELKVEPNQG